MKHTKSKFIIIISILILISLISSNKLFAFSPCLNLFGASIEKIKMEKKVLIHGDIHGELSGFQDNLINENLVNVLGEWIAEDTTLIVTGDLIDRGPKSIETYDYLMDLQKQAKEKKNGSEVIILLGNHEQYILRGIFDVLVESIEKQGTNRLMAFNQALRLRNRMIDDVISGKIVGSTVVNGDLVTHAGMRTEIRLMLKEEFAQLEGIPVDEVTVEQISWIHNINWINAVVNEDFSPPMFQADARRGGVANVGGTTWNDAQDIDTSMEALIDFDQIFGHSAAQKGEALIRLYQDGRGICVDAGHYAGRRAYVIMESGEIITVEGSGAGYERKVVGKY
ncbi:MAG: metallophosphoesterase [Pseudomonadota bacterium]